MKKVHWDCFWNIDDDSALLKGVYEYGMGSWESVKMDDKLGLSDRVNILVCFFKGLVPCW